MLTCFTYKIDGKKYKTGAKLFKLINRIIQAVAEQVRENREAEKQCNSAKRMREINVKPFWFKTEIQVSKLLSRKSGKAAVSKQSQ